MRPTGGRTDVPEPEAGRFPLGCYVFGGGGPVRPGRIRTAWEGRPPCSRPSACRPSHHLHTDRGLHIHSSHLAGRPIRQTTRCRRAILSDHVDNIIKSLAERAALRAAGSRQPPGRGLAGRRSSCPPATASTRRRRRPGRTCTIGSRAARIMRWSPPGSHRLARCFLADSQAPRAARPASVTFWGWSI